MSHTHQVAGKGQGKDYFIAMVAATVETADPERELRPGLDLLGTIVEK